MPALAAAGTATATLSRSAFGITAWHWAIGDTVQLRIEAEAVRDQGTGLHDGSEDQTTDAAPDQPNEPAAP